MRVRDLGEMEGEVLLFGGPYSNLHALQALRDRAGAQGLPPERAICTGDVAAYCADPGPSVSLLRDWGAAVVAGNCERQIAAGAGDCGCGFEAGTACDLLSRGWYAHARAGLDEAARGWMAALPDMAVFTHAGHRCAVIHGGLRDIARFLWPVSPDAAFEDEIAAIRQACGGPVDIVVAGHCGIAFQRQIGRVLWVNAGAVGLPPHDGRPATRFATLSADGVRFHRLEYDHGAAAAAMAAAGLDQGYDRALISGIWPSEDVLPPELRRGV
jgi:predicted phosphodiesterase